MQGRVLCYDGLDIKTSLGNYRPDFIVNFSGQDWIIELKGWMDPESATKVSEALEQFYNFIVIDETKLLELEQSQFFTLST